MIFRKYKGVTNRKVLLLTKIQSLLIFNAIDISQKLIEYHEMKNRKRTNK